MDMKKLSHLCSLTREEIDYIENNIEQYRDLMDELENEYEKYRENLKEKSFLQGRIASINYSSYEEFMRVHSNAIKISAMIAELEMSGLTRRNNLDRKVKELLDKYLLLKQFK
ncbi:hypothetical protein ACNF42_07145 [Cuniculiplasma sp. SKW3]